MKKVLLATALSLTVCFTNLPVAAQRINTLNSINRINKYPVRYAEIAAFSEGSGVWLTWKTDFEAKNLGFYLYRVNGGEKELVNKTLIPGAYLQAREEKITSGSYSFFDANGDANSIYTVESVSYSGQTHDSGLIQTKLVDDLTPLAGNSSAQLDEQTRNANPVTLSNESILPSELAAEMESNRSEPNPVNQRWVAAQPGVKIAVKTEGFHRVSRTDLQTNGFDVSAPSERWQLFLNGVEQAIIVGENGSFIEFYGNGIDTLESDRQIYYLVVGSQNGRRITSTNRRRINGSVASESYSQAFFKKERTFYNANILNGDAENAFGTTISSTLRTINFNLSGVDFSSANASFDITAQGITLAPHEIKVILNNVELGLLIGNNFDSMTRRFNIPTSVLKEGSNALQFISQAGASDFSAFDNLKIEFARRYQAEQNRISFHVPNYKANYVTGFTSSDVRVFDTTNPEAPILIENLSVEQNGGTYRVYLPSNRGRVMFATTNAGLLTPAAISRNVPSTLSTANNNGNLIIIAHKDFLSQAENWAAYRRQQGMTVKVVNSEDIFDEFNFGMVKADAIRDFLRFAKNNWQTPPNYVLLIGDATFDPKNYFGLNANYVPTRMVDTIYTETGSDESLADFDDDGLAEIAIGRIPARSGDIVTLILEKTISFEQTLNQGLSRGVVLASDLPDGYDFEGVNDRLCEQLPAGTPCKKVNRGQPNANAELVNELNNGRFLVNYAGHGNINVWATNGFFSNAHAANLTNGDGLSIFTLLTCLNGYFINPNDTLSEVLLNNSSGGAAAVWASTGLTTPDVQETMATRFYNQIGTANSGTRIGDLIKDAKSTINSGRDVRLSWALLGDPTLKIK